VENTSVSSIKKGEKKDEREKAIDDRRREKALPFGGGQVQETRKIT